MTPRIHTRNALPSCLAALFALALALAPALSAAADNRSPTPPLAESAKDRTVHEGEGAQLRLQVLLDRARFSPGQIDGLAGSNQQRALRGFQQARGLEATGEADAATWEALEQDHAPVLVQHRLTEADIAGPYAELPDDMMEQAELEQLGYASLAEALGERFHASPALLRKLNPELDDARAGDAIVVPAVATGALPAAARIVVDRSDSVLQLLDAQDTLIAQFPASTGSERDPLPVGEWKVVTVVEDPTFHYNPELFWDADPAHSKATLAPGPNNPVGTVWIDLDKKHYGIHGTPAPEGVGKGQSHGCIRLTNWDARAVAAAVRAGVPVTLQE